MIFLAMNDGTYFILMEEIDGLWQKPGEFDSSVWELIDDIIARLHAMPDARMMTIDYRDRHLMLVKTVPEEASECFRVLL